MTIFVRHEEKAVCKPPRPSESVSYNVMQSKTHSALFQLQELPVRHVTPLNVFFWTVSHDLHVDQCSVKSSHEKNMLLVALNRDDSEWKVISYKWFECSDSCYRVHFTIKWMLHYFPSEDLKFSK